LRSSLDNKARYACKAVEVLLDLCAEAAAERMSEDREQASSREEDRPEGVSSEQGDAEDAEESTIPPERRTRPLGVAEAAKLMGYQGSAKARTDRLRGAMKAGAIRSICINRQSYVFDRNDFPKESQPKLTPSHPNSPQFT
jgi:hypothetical protein